MSKIGFVGGGQMAFALASGALDAGVIRPADLIFAQPGAEKQKKLKQQFPKSKVVSYADELLDEAEQVVLAVKPHVLREIAPDLKPLINPEHLVVSIAAGISLESLQQMLGTQRIVRVMPNTPCQVGCGASAMSADDDMADSDIQWVTAFMSGVGTLERIPDRLMHAFTGIAGSSPAYIYLVIEALSDGGVAQGLPRNLATKMAAQAVLGAAKMVLETGQHPGVLKDQVTSPGGTTIAAIRALEQAGVRAGFMEAVDACTERSEELS